MTENIEEIKIKDIVESFEVAMKKGFLSGLIMLLLEKEPCHGYKLLKEIQKRTLGVWHPSSSNIYPLLDSLSEKGLIECIEEKEIGRHKKIYEITPKGQETLKMLLHKHSIMIDSIRSIVLSTLGITDIHDPSFLEDLEKIISFPPVKMVMENSVESKIDILKYNKEMIKQRILIMNNNLEMIDKILSKLYSEVKNENFNHDSNKLSSINVKENLEVKKWEL
jgi:DNA-binding PadR family transcriptional regulator